MWRAIALLLLCFSLYACDSAKDYIVQIQPPEQASNFAKRADIVVIKNPTGLVALSAISATSWFQKRDQIITQWANQIEIQRVELVPSPGAPPFVTSFSNPDIVAILVYESTGNQQTRREIKPK